MARAPFNVLVLPFRPISGRKFEYAIFRRSDAGYWQFVAGGGEDEEGPLEAARREANEEAGIPASARFFPLETRSSIPVFYFGDRDHWPADQYVIPGYHYGVDASEVEIRLSRAHTEYRWVDPETARELLRWQSDAVAVWELNERLLNVHLPDPE